MDNRTRRVRLTLGGIALLVILCAIGAAHGLTAPMGSVSAGRTTPPVSTFETGSALPTEDPATPLEPSGTEAPTDTPTEPASPTAAGPSASTDDTTNPSVSPWHSNSSAPSRPAATHTPDRLPYQWAPTSNPATVTDLQDNGWTADPSPTEPGAAIGPAVSAGASRQTLKDIGFQEAFDCQLWSWTSPSAPGITVFTRSGGGSPSASDPVVMLTWYGGSRMAAISLEGLHGDWTANAPGLPILVTQLVRSVQLGIPGAATVSGYGIAGYVVYS